MTVRQVFFAAFGKGKYDRLMSDGRYSIDLWRIMEDQLLSCGIKAGKHIGGALLHLLR